jgi:hypothetical protein
MKFNVKHKLSQSQQKVLQDECVVLSMEYNMSLKNLRVLLNKNQALVIDIKFVATMLNLKISLLLGAIQVEPVGAGFPAFVNQSIFKRVKVVGCQVQQVRQLDQVKAE